MWIIKTHIALSVLILITFIGFRKIFREKIFENGYCKNSKKEKITAYWIFFVPILNVMCLIGEMVMIFVKKENLDNL